MYSLNETYTRENLFTLKQVPKEKETLKNHIFEQVVE